MIILTVPLQRQEFFEKFSDGLIEFLEYRLDLCENQAGIDFSAFTERNILAYHQTPIPDSILEGMISSKALIDINNSQYKLIADRVSDDRLILSIHLDEYNEAAILELLDSPFNPYAMKIALQAKTFAEILQASELIEKSGRSNIIFSITGKWGKFQRIFYEFFNSQAVYLYLLDPTAPGQLSLFEYTQVQAVMIQNGSLIAGIIGDQRVNESASYEIYNYEFNENKVAVHFVPIPAADVEEAIAVIRWLNKRFEVLGFAITSPFKKALAQSLGSHIQVINTIVLSDSRSPTFFYCQKLDAFVRYQNTDTQALQQILTERAIPLDSTVTIHGTGACAEAFITTLKKLGYKHIHLQGRNHSRLSELRQRFDLSDLCPTFTDLLINVTPLGLAEDDDISHLPDYGFLIDLPYDAIRTSSIVSDAEARQIPCVSGMQFWYYQHVVQAEELLQLLEPDEE